MAPLHGKVLLVMAPALGNLVAFTLRHIGCETRNAATLGDATKTVDEWKPDLVIADYDRVPKVLELTERGAKHHSPPIVAMTRRRDTPLKLKAYDEGAHDIIEVPFTPDEIVGRAIAALRRTRGIRAAIVPKVRVGDLEVDIMRGSVRLDGSEFRLTPLQHTLLYLLAANSEVVLGRDEIIQNIWGSDEVIESNVVDRHVRDLRVKLHDTWREPRFIETVPGKGYRFRPSVEARAANAAD